MNLSVTTKSKNAHKWIFPSRFRAKAYSWKSSALAGKRIGEAVSEISKTVKTAPHTAGEGVVLFLEKLVPAIEGIDSSSGSLGNATNKAVLQLTQVFKSLPIDTPTRKVWLDRIWQAFEEDSYGYLDHIGESWGDLCGNPEIAQEWASTLLPTLLMFWGERTAGGYYKGSGAALASMLAAGRFKELLEVIDKAPYVWWLYRQFGVKALVELGKPEEAIAYAKASKGLNDSQSAIDSTCEEILLSHGKWKDAYEEYGLYAEWSGSYLQRFRNLVKQYPQMAKEKILEDLINTSIDEDKGTWFATAKEVGDLDLALELATKYPGDPKTLNRAGRDYLERNPEFALGVSLAGLKWIVQGYGYELTGMDVLNTVSHGLKAAEALGKREAVKWQMREVVKGDPRIREIAKVYLTDQSISTSG